MPVMICPKWVFTRIQPIAIRNVLDYLVEAIQTPESADRIIEIGGQDVLTYAEMMTRYARVRALKRLLIAVPVLTPRLSSYWVHLITPIPANIAQPLIKGLTNEVVVHDDTAHRLFPNIQLLDYETSVRLAFEKIKNRGVETSWTDALTSSHRGKAPVALLTKEGMIIERRQRTVAAPVEAVYRAFARLGGRNGMALPELDVENTGTRRSALWRSRDETRTARCRGCACGRRVGLLARGSCRSRKDDSPPRRDESARTRLA